MSRFLKESQCTRELMAESSEVVTGQDVNINVVLLNGAVTKHMKKNVHNKVLKC